MNIEQLSPARFVISLSKEDMTAFALDYNNICREDAVFQKVFKRLVALAAQRITIPLKNKSLLVEAIERPCGCILIITVMPRHSACAKRYRVKAADESIMFSFDCADDLTDCMAQLYKNGFRCISGEVYLYDGDYYAIIKSGAKCPRRALGLLSEYGSEPNENALKISFIREHGSRLAAGFPVIRIGAAFAALEFGV